MANFVVVDVFACSLDQVGTLEIRTLVSRTGGLFVLADKFGQSVFRESLRRAFERVPVDPAAGGAGGPAQLQMGFGGHIEVLHSREFKEIVAMVLKTFSSTPYPLNLLTLKPVTFNPYFLNSLAPTSFTPLISGLLQVLHSREFKIAGAIGPCASLKKTGIYKYVCIYMNIYMYI